MHPLVVRRYVILSALLLLLLTAIVLVGSMIGAAPPGDYAVRQGDLLLTDRKFDAAIERFDAALAVSPNHRGARMGRAIALLESGRIDEAEAEFGRLIALLESRTPADDPTGQAVLAGAYANRGILLDRTARYEAALDDYRRALAIDRAAVSGPGLLDRLVYGNPRPSNIEGRAAYLAGQLALPPQQRLLRVPEIDARQRMHKP